MLEREQPVGVVIQFGGQTPLKLARAIEEAGFRVLGTPFEAIDLAEDRERFGGARSTRSASAARSGGSPSRRRGASRSRERIGYPVLVRPSYVLGGRAMRVCYTPKHVVDAFHANVHGRDARRPLPRERDRDRRRRALRRPGHVHRRASCSTSRRPASTPATPRASCRRRRCRRRRSARSRTTVRALARGLGVVGLLNVQLAIADGEVFVLEANPRASRTVPFASKATGVNLVRAACRLALGEKLDELALPPERPPAQVSVKAAVLPFPRFPGSDPVLGPEMRATGEVMASAADLPTAFAKAERAAGRRLPTSGTVFLSVRDADKPALVPVAAALAGLGFALVATEGTAATLEAAGLEVERIRKMIEQGVGATVVDLVRRGRCDLVINTPQGYGARTDGYAIREAALVNRVPCITTVSGAAAAVHAIASARTEVTLSLQERIEFESANGLASSARRLSGRTRF